MLRPLAGGIVLLSLCLGPLNTPVHAEGELPATEIARLSNLVRQDCGSCHGLTLKGGLGRPLTAQHLADMDHEMVKHVILFGVDQTPMPGWLGLLSEQEADWIANALKTGAFQQ